MRLTFLDLLYENETFQNMPAAVKFYALNALYHLYKRKVAVDKIPSLQLFSECPNGTFQRHKDEILRIITELLPEFYQIDIKNRAQPAKGTLKHAENANKRKLERYAGTLSEGVTDNPAPLMPQLSAQSKNLSRQRRLHENMPVRKPQSTKSKPPVLTEKPTQ